MRCPVEILQGKQAACAFRARTVGQQRGITGAHGHSTGIRAGHRFPRSPGVMLKDFPS
jgi:hypothetical protein